MKSLSCFLILLFFASAMQAQQFSEGNLTVKYAELGSQYLEIHTQEAVIFSAKLNDCNRPENGIYQEMVFFKFVNTSNQDLVIEYDVLLWYDDVLWTRVPVSPEKHKVLVLGAGEMIEADCDPNSEYYYDIAAFAKFLNYSNKPELTKIQLSNLKVKLK